MTGTTVQAEDGWNGLWVGYTEFVSVGRPDLTGLAVDQRNIQFTHSHIYDNLPIQVQNLVPVYQRLEVFHNIGAQ